MKQFDQDTSAYRVKSADGRWTNRVDRKLARWMAAIGAAFLLFMGWRFVAEGGNGSAIAFFGLMGVCIGVAFTLSVRSID